MRTQAEFLVCTTAAAAILWAGFALNPLDPGSEAAGAGGADLLSFEASTASIAAMVEDWERPPELMQAVAMEPPPALSTPPAPPMFSDAAPGVAPPAAVALPELPDLTDPAVAELPPQPPAPPPELQTEIASFAAPAAPAAPEPPSPDLAAPSPMAPKMPEPPRPPAPEPPALAPEPAPPVPQARPLPAKIHPPPRPDLTRPEQPRAEAPPQPKQAEKPGSDAPDSARQRAAGTGGGAAAGAGQQASATLTKAQRTSLLAGWGAAIRSRIERQKRYPSQAGRAQGAVALRVQVSASGALVGVGISRSSGNPALDQAALQAVRSARFPAAPDGVPLGSHAFSLTMNFSR